MRTTKQTLGIIIKRKRIRLGLIQRELAEVLGVDRGTIIAWETDKHYPVDLKKGEIADWIGMDVDDLPGPTPGHGSTRGRKLGRRGVK